MKMANSLSVADETCQTPSSRQRLRWRISASWILPLLLLTLPAVVEAQFNYTTNNGTITITKYIGSDAAVTIPDSINGLPVTSIGALAFQAITSVASVTIPDTVTIIGNDAFDSCTGLTNIAIPNRVVNVGSGAFGGCTSLISVTIGESVTNIGDGAFVSCTSLTRVTFPNSVISIGSDVFRNCYNVTGVIIPNSVTSIGDSVFNWCLSLTNVLIPNSVTNIGGGVFYYCTNLSAITVDALSSSYGSVDGVLFNKDQTTLIQYPGGKTGNYTVPNSVAKIESLAFANCVGLTSVAIPDSVTSIEYRVFDSCTSLTNVTLGHYVANIGSSAFSGCTSLTHVTIPDSVINIGSFSFTSCSSLTSVIIGSGVASIGEYAFYNCTSLTGVYFRGDAPSIGFGGTVFVPDVAATGYYLPGTTNWNTTFDGLPTALWRPRVETTDGGFGIRRNQFGFNINWARGMVVAVEACTNLANPTWSSVATNTLISGSVYFSDPKWTNYPGGFYRVRMQ